MIPARERTRGLCVSEMCVPPSGQGPSFPPEAGAVSLTAREKVWTDLMRGHAESCGRL